MARWEYTKIHLSELPRQGDDVDLLNDAGSSGWELVGITNNNIAYLKRLIAEPAPQAVEKTVRRRKVSSPAADAD
jgi:hypothetical protein